MCGGSVDYSPLHYQPPIQQHQPHQLQPQQQQSHREGKRGSGCHEATATHHNDHRPGPASSAAALALNAAVAGSPASSSAANAPDHSVARSAAHAAGRLTAVNHAHTPAHASGACDQDAADMVGQDQDQLQGQEQTKDDIAGEGEVEDEGLHGRHNPEKLSRLFLGYLTPVPNNSSVSSNKWCQRWPPSCREVPHTPGVPPVQHRVG